MLVTRCKAFVAVMALTLFFPFAANAAVPADIPKARIAVLGGTFLNDIIFHHQGIKVHDGGVVVQTRGGRFETVAEINMMQRWKNYTRALIRSVSTSSSPHCHALRHYRVNPVCPTA